jgi:uncharacterized protein GlcG (DUF336 family)
MKTLFSGAITAAVLTLFATGVWASDAHRAACKGLPGHASLRAALVTVVAAQNNGGFGNDMWATVVNRDGVVCTVVYSGNARDEQWSGSRVISAQKANTANAFSLENSYPNVIGIGRSLASGNLYGLTMPGGSLFGLQHSNPVDPAVAYAGNPNRYGRPNDPLVGRKVGGINVFGGGLALYDDSGEMLGGLGASGDTACADHIIAWRVRDALGLGNIPGGIGDSGTTDNLVLVNPPTPNSFQHPSCGFAEDGIIADLPVTNPPGP